VQSSVSQSKGKSPHIHLCLLIMTEVALIGQIRSFDRDPPPQLLSWSCLIITSTLIHSCSKCRRSWWLYCLLLLHNAAYSCSWFIWLSCCVSLHLQAVTWTKWNQTTQFEGCTSGDEARPYGCSSGNKKIDRVHDLSHIVTADAIRVICFADSHAWATHVWKRQAKITHCFHDNHNLYLQNNFFLSSRTKKM